MQRPGAKNPYRNAEPQCPAAGAADASQTSAHRSRHLRVSVAGRPGHGKKKPLGGKLLISPFYFLDHPDREKFMGD
jgi:hypothetical protein